MGKTFLKAANIFIGVITLCVLGYSAWNLFATLGQESLPTVLKILPANQHTLNKQQGWPDGWKPGETQWFHHASQGTRILPRDWFINLQQPSLDPYAPLMIEGDYLQRFGFLPSEKDARLNPDGLPIGFAVDWKFDAPYANPPSSGPVIGLTCAACHTGRIVKRDEHGGYRSARIEGGSAMINISAFQNELGKALAFTVEIPTRLNRFLHAVLKEKYVDEEERNKLTEQLTAYYKAGLKQKNYATEHHLTGTPAGFARTDALSLIGNRVFVALGNENLIVPDAPVNFPPLWDTSWYDWVQYNGSIRMPLVRNIGEALGVGAAVNLRKNRWKQFDSTVDVENLAAIEDQLGGLTSLAGLQAPRWADLVKDEILPPIQDGPRKLGETLYVANCQRCHLPPMQRLKEYVNDKENKLPEAEREELKTFFEVDAGGPNQRILKLKLVDLQEVGTDPNQALDFYRRVAVFEGQTISAALGLYITTEFIRRDKFADLKIPSEPKNNPRLLQFNRFRDFNPPKNAEVMKGEGMKSVLVANLKYRARTLDGIWATPPFLHNGSVPSLRQLLSPAEKRDKTFYLGTTVYDPKDVGYETQEIPGAFLMDTSKPGNSNAGHEFRDLTLEEFESIPELFGDPDVTGSSPPPEDEDFRWGRVLGISREEYRALSEEKRTEAKRVATKKALEVPRVKADHPFRGVLGAELTDKERNDLMEYVKSL